MLLATAAGNGLVSLSGVFVATGACNGLDPVQSVVVNDWLIWVCILILSVLATASGHGCACCSGLCIRMLAYHDIKAVSMCACCIACYLFVLVRWLHVLTSLLRVMFVSAETFGFLVGLRLDMSRMVFVLLTSLCPGNFLVV